MATGCHWGVRGVIGVSGVSFFLWLCVEISRVLKESQTFLIWQRKMVGGSSGYSSVNFQGEMNFEI